MHDFLLCISVLLCEELAACPECTPPLTQMAAGNWSHHNTSRVGWYRWMDGWMEHLILYPTVQYLVFTWFYLKSIYSLEITTYLCLL